MLLFIKEYSYFFVIWEDTLVFRECQELYAKYVEIFLSGYVNIVIFRLLKVKALSNKC